MNKYIPLTLFLFNSEIISLAVVIYYGYKFVTWLFIEMAKGGAFD